LQELHHPIYLGEKERRGEVCSGGTKEKEKKLLESEPSEWKLGEVITLKMEHKTPWGGGAGRHRGGGVKGVGTKRVWGAKGGERKTSRKAARLINGRKIEDCPREGNKELGRTLL